MNVIPQLEFELAFYDSAVHRFNHNTTRTPPKSTIPNKEIVHTVKGFPVFLSYTNTFHTIKLFQVFLSNTNNLHSVIWSQVFVSNIKKLCTVVLFQVFLSNTNNLHTGVWFEVFLSNTNNLHSVKWFQVFLYNTNNLQLYAIKYSCLIGIIFRNIRLIDGTTNPGQSWPGSNDNKANSLLPKTSLSPAVKDHT